MHAKEKGAPKGFETDSLDVVYGNVRIRRVVQDALSGALILSVVCAEREDQRIIYHDVLYTQIDQSAEGERVAIAARTAYDAFTGARHRTSAERMIRECGLNNLDSLIEMGRRGYLIYSHYIVESDERIVIAKGLTLG